MKKYISMFMFALLSCFALVSCDTETDESAGGTAVEQMAGIWDVQVDAVDENGNVLYEDPYGLGTITVNTYNTAANSDKEMWLQDAGFYGVQMKVNVDYAAKTFSVAAGSSYNPSNAEAGNVELLEGQVLLNQGKNLHGLPCDSICYKVKFSDDENALTYRISGVRHSGFYE